MSLIYMNQTIKMFHEKNVTVDLPEGIPIGCIHNKLNNDNIEGSTNSYTYLDKTIGKDLNRKIWETNDDTFNPNKPDYSNVLPLIKSLPVTS